MFVTLTPYPVVTESSMGCLASSWLVQKTREMDGTRDVV